MERWVDNFYANQNSWFSHLILSILPPTNGPGISQKMEDDLHNIMGRRKDGGPADTKAQEHDVKTSTGFLWQLSLEPGLNFPGQASITWHFILTFSLRLGPHPCLKWFKHRREHEEFERTNLRVELLNLNNEESTTDTWWSEYARKPSGNTGGRSEESSGHLLLYNLWALSQASIYFFLCSCSSKQWNLYM